MFNLKCKHVCMYVYIQKVRLSKLCNGAHKGKLSAINNAFHKTNLCTVVKYEKALQKTSK